GEGSVVALEKRPPTGMWCLRLRGRAERLDSAPGNPDHGGRGNLADRPRGSKAKGLRLGPWSLSEGTISSLVLAADPATPWSGGARAEWLAVVRQPARLRARRPRGQMSLPGSRYPEYPDQVVASGWTDGTEMMTGRAAIIEVRLGK